MDIIDFAKRLRRHHTETEMKLWSCLRARRFMGLKFRRQFPLEPYIVDFICLENKLIIEIDGGQHNERVKYDMKRTEYLNKLGYKVLRFWNSDIFNQFDIVLEEIRKHVI